MWPRLSVEVVVVFFLSWYISSTILIRPLPPVPSPRFPSCGCWLVFFVLFFTVRDIHVVYDVHLGWRSTSPPIPLHYRAQAATASLSATLTSKSWCDVFHLHMLSLFCSSCCFVHHEAMQWGIAMLSFASKRAVKWVNFNRWVGGCRAEHWTRLPHFVMFFGPTPIPYPSPPRQIFSRKFLFIYFRFDSIIASSFVRVIAACIYSGVYIFST